MNQRFTGIIYLTIRTSKDKIYIVEQSAYVHVQYMRRGLQMFDMQTFTVFEPLTRSVQICTVCWQFLSQSFSVSPNIVS